MDIAKRFKEPIPKFFKKLMAFGASLLAVSAGILSAPSIPGFEMPALLTTIASYSGTIGAVLIAVSKFTVKEEPDNKEIKE